MTAVRKLAVVVCCLAAPALFAQTKPATAAAPSTPPVTADTDRDIDNPRALRLSLDDALKTAMERNVGIQLSRY